MKITLSAFSLMCIQVTQVSPVDICQNRILLGDVQNPTWDLGETEISCGCIHHDWSTVGNWSVISEGQKWWIGIKSSPAFSWIFLDVPKQLAKPTKSSNSTTCPKTTANHVRHAVASLHWSIFEIIPPPLPSLHSFAAAFRTDVFQRTVATGPGKLPMLPQKSVWLWRWSKISHSHHRCPGWFGRVASSFTTSLVIFSSLGTLW